MREALWLLDSKWIRYGPSRCRTIGCSARRSGSRSMLRNISGSFIEQAHSSPENFTPLQPPARLNAVHRLRQFFHLIRKEHLSIPGAARERVTTGQAPITESRSITKATSGSEVTGVEHSLPPHKLRPTKD